MRGLTITESTQDGRFLSTDLIDILRLLGSHGVNAEWEIERPHGSPQFHRWLLTEKFRLLRSGYGFGERLSVFHGIVGRHLE